MTKAVIDAHLHLWDLTVRDPQWTHSRPTLHRSYTLDDLAPQLAIAGVDQAVVVQSVALAEETVELLDLAARSPLIAGVVGWIDLTAPNVSERLAALRDASGGSRLVGVRHLVQSEADPRWLLRSDVQRGLIDTGRAGLVYDLLVTAEQREAAIDVVRALPQVRFVLDHGGKPSIADGELDPWRDQITVLARLPNVAVKLSGLVTEAGPHWRQQMLIPYVEHLLEHFGTDRCMMGSDWPVCLERASYEHVTSCMRELIEGVSGSERSALLGGTATRWYRIAGAA